jgi:hypothetical protein
MGVEAYYAVAGEEQGVEGDHVASLSGWDAWSSWAADLGEDWPYAVRLADGESWPVDALKDELRRLVRRPPGDPPPDVRSVTERLLEVVGDAPEGCEGIIISDGEPSEDGEDAEDEEEEDQ